MYKKYPKQHTILNPNNSQKMTYYKLVLYFSVLKFSKTVLYNSNYILSQIADISLTSTLYF